MLARRPHRFLLILVAACSCSAAPSAERLDLVQRQTLRYFYDRAHPACGLALERSSDDETVTIGGSGFGCMALVVGADRGFITRDQFLGRMSRILTFLERADRFHGVWPHWLYGSTGRVKPFSPKDDGGDLVETAFLVQGLLAVRRYLADAPAERALAARIDALVDGVEWDFYTRGEDALYWHWSPNHGWAMNMPIRGWNEALIVYVLAAGARRHAVAPSVYHRGWARDGAMACGQTWYGTTLPLGPTMGGPLFFAHYSFLALDPRGLRDRYADYWQQNVAHTRINYEYCVANPAGHAGYGPDCWGLTASDTPGGYTAHAPTNDRGVVTPTAALSSFPYLPDEAAAALAGFFAAADGRLFGQLGFRDAFHPGTGWIAADYLAIDQGPIVVMIENHRSGLLWRLGNECPVIRQGLERLGFSRVH